MDWFVALAPLLGLILILVFGFTGCSVDRSGLRVPDYRLIVTVVFFPPAEPPRAEPQLTVTNASGASIAAAVDTPVDSLDGSRTQTFSFDVGVWTTPLSVRCSVVQAGTTLIPESGGMVVVSGGQRLYVSFTAVRPPTAGRGETFFVVTVHPEPIAR